jgi:hypothetical protein
MKKHKTFNEMFEDDDFVTPEEREKINFEVSVIGKMIEAREGKGLSQGEPAEIGGIKRS